MLLLAALSLSPVDLQHLERPELVLAQGLVESGCNPYARGKAGEIGAFQVLESDWGRVPKSLLPQAMKTDRILDELVEEHGDLNTGIERYNGSGRTAAPKRYRVTVVRKTLELCLLGEGLQHEAYLL